MASARGGGRETTWELTTDQFTLANVTAWHKFVDGIVEDCRVPLGVHVSVNIKATLHNMMVLQQATSGGGNGKGVSGGDTTRKQVDSAFGTLVVVLPGRFAGGKLLVQQEPSLSSSSTKTKTKPLVWDACALDPFAVKYAAFYGDESRRHTQEPVASGYQLCLTYTLIAATATAAAAPQFGSNHTLYTSLKTALSAFFTDDAHQEQEQEDHRPPPSKRPRIASSSPTPPNLDHIRQCRFVYLLSEKYTHKELSLTHLTQKDTLVAASVAAFCQATGDQALGLFWCKVTYNFEWASDRKDYYNSEEELDEGHDGDSLDKFLDISSPWLPYRRYAAPHSGADTAEPPAPVAVTAGETADLATEVVPIGFFDQENVDFDFISQQTCSCDEGSELTKKYTTAALVVVPLAKVSKRRFPAKASNTRPKNVVATGLRQTQTSNKETGKHKWSSSRKGTISSWNKKSLPRDPAGVAQTTCHRWRNTKIQPRLCSFTTRDAKVSVPAGLLLILRWFLSTRERPTHTSA